MNTATPPALPGLSRAVVEAIVREVVTERLGRSPSTAGEPTPTRAVLWTAPPHSGKQVWNYVHAYRSVAQNSINKEER